MRVVMDRNQCGAWKPACEECFAMFVRNLSTDRACFVEVTDDASPDIHLLIRSGAYTSDMTITPENREAIQREGWIKFSDLPEEAFDIKPPRGEDVRTAQNRS